MPQNRTCMWHHGWLNWSIGHIGWCCHGGQGRESDTKFRKACSIGRESWRWWVQALRVHVLPHFIPATQWDRHQDLHLQMRKLRLWRLSISQGSKPVSDNLGIRTVSIWIEILFSTPQTHPLPARLAVLKMGPLVIRWATCRVWKCISKPGLVSRSNSWACSGW